MSGVGCIDQPEHELKPGPPAAPYGDRPGASPAQGVAGNVRSVVSAAIFKDADCLNSPPQLDRLSEAKKIQDVSLGSRSLSRHMADGQCDLAARLAQPVGTRHARCARPSWSSSQCLPAGTTRWHAASDWVKKLWRPAAAQPHWTSARRHAASDGPSAGPRATARQRVRPAETHARRHAAGPVRTDTQRVRLDAEPVHFPVDRTRRADAACPTFPFISQSSSARVSADPARAARAARISRERTTGFISVVYTHSSTDARRSALVWSGDCRAGARRQGREQRDDRAAGHAGA